MKNKVHIVSAVVAIATFAVWASGGFHTGWSQTQIPVTGMDEITGIEFTVYEDGFVAGLEFLAGGLFLAALISVISLSVPFFRKRSQPQP